MNHLNRWLMLAGAGVVFSLGCGPLVAQPRTDWSNIDPAQIQQQIQQRMLEFLRDRLVVTNDDEWNVIAPRLTKVAQMQIERFISGSGMASIRFGGQGPGPGRFPGFGQPSPELQALQQAIDAKASTADLKAVLAKYLEARKRKLAELRQAQADLREVLTLRQESTLTLIGLLD